MHDIIVIGGGAAALSAAAYGLGKQLDVLIVYETLGGKAGQRFSVRSKEDFLVGHILVHLAFPDDHPIGEAQFAGEETVHLFERQIRARSGVALRDRVIGVTRLGNTFQVETERHGYHKGTTVIVATGVVPKLLDVPGAQDFLGLGLGYSATTYARMLDGKTAAVIGTTRRALRGAAELAHGAEKVYLIAPEPANHNDPLFVALKNLSNVKILEDCTVKEVLGVHSVEHVVVEMGAEINYLSVDAAFIDLGLYPNTAMLEGLVELDGEGFIKVDYHNAASTPGVFAAGDVTTAFGEQVLIAIGDGARAALSAYDYLLAHGR